MNNENQTRVCNCKENEKKVISLLNDNGNLLQMIRDVRSENEQLKSGSNLLGSPQVGSRRPVGTGTTNDDNPDEYVKSLIDINRGWKKDFEELQMRCEMLSGEKKLLEEEEKELKETIVDFENRQGPLESEIARLATALYKQSEHERHTSSSDEQCEVLKTQIIIYKEDFERERRDRETIHEEREKLKQELEGAEEIIERLTTELDACKAPTGYGAERISIRGENGYLNERSGFPVQHQFNQLVHPISPVMPANEYRWRLEQQRRGIVPRNPPPTSFFYGGDVEVDDSYSSLSRA